MGTENSSKGGESKLILALPERGEGEHATSLQGPCPTSGIPSFQPEDLFFSFVLMLN